MFCGTRYGICPNAAVLRFSSLVNIFTAFLVNETFSLKLSLFGTCDIIGHMTILFTAHRGARRPKFLDAQNEK